MEDAHGKPLPHLHGTPRDPEVLLFHLESDPSETRNVADTHPEIRDALQTELTAWHENELSLRNGHDPLKQNGLSLSYEVFMKRLRARHQK